MNILALDTSTDRCSVALWMKGEVLARDVLAGQRHSELLLPMVGEVLVEGGVSLKSLDGIAFGEGPGSFTGLRIGCGVAQGLALGADLPVAGIGTLLALAEGSGRDRVIACLDARMGEIYHAVYEKREGEWQVVSPPRLCSPGEVPDVGAGRWTGAGNGFAAYGELLAAGYAGRLEEVMPDLHPRAADMARLAESLFEQGLGMDAAYAAPCYLRDKVALKTSER